VNVTQDALYELGVQRRSLAHGPMWERVEEALGEACQRYALRHGGYPAAVGEVCSSLREDLVDDVADMASRVQGGRGDWWDEVTVGACVGALGECSPEEAAAAGAAGAGGGPPRPGGGGGGVIFDGGVLDEL